MAQYWNTHDIETLKNLFLQKRSLKEMGCILGRSPSSINKALERHGIRPKRYVYDSRCTPKKDDKQWVNIKHVLHYIHRIGLDVEKRKEDYLLEGMNYTPLQLLMIANKRRIDQKKPIFYVNNVTW